MKRQNNNIAFIDGQNLYIGTKKDSWAVDLRRFRVYLTEKHSVKEAYWFIGYVDESLQDIYDDLGKSGFRVVFRKHSVAQSSSKKGNVDTDLVFEVMRTYIERRSDFSKIVLVSGDGDYKKMVDWLIEKDVFEKILFPSRKRSILYNNLRSRHFACLEDVRDRIERKKTR